MFSKIQTKSLKKIQRWKIDIKKNVDWQEIDK